MRSRRRSILEPRDAFFKLYGDYDGCILARGCGRDIYIWCSASRFCQFCRELGKIFSFELTIEEVLLAVEVRIIRVC